MSDIRYLETTVFTTTPGVEVLGAMLSCLGITEISVEDSNDARLIMEQKDSLAWDFVSDEILLDAAAHGKSDTAREAILKFYTEDNIEGRKLLSAVKEKLSNLHSDATTGVYGKAADLGTLASLTRPLDENWKDKYKEYFKTFEITEGIIVRPPWEEVPVTDKIVITIDPGMAFGTGTHETTSMCVSAIKAAFSQIKIGGIAPTGSPNSASLLDIGTGSGILSIIASKLGFGNVVAVEIDEDALRSARDNVYVNDSSPSVKLILGDVTQERVLKSLLEMSGQTGFGYDVVVCNLTSGLLLFLLPHMIKLLTAGGKLILSGILADEEVKMVQAMESVGLSDVIAEGRGEWLCITAVYYA